MIFFKKVKMIDFLNDNIKLNFARETPKDKRTQCKEMSETLFKMFINISGCNLLTRFRYEFRCEGHGMLDALGCSNLRTMEIRCMENALDELILTGCRQIQVRAC